ncbi:TPA: DUF551 domain-containing protein [Enterobacter hormaechei subsp. hoffmannii]
MSTITKELAKLFRKITNSEIDAEGNAHVVLSPADSLLINNARIALASLEAEKCAEPVAFINGAWTLVYYRPPKELGLKIGDKLYTAPPATVSVPAAMEMDDDFDSAFEHGKAVGWNAYRAAMLQGADRPQNEPQNIPENIPATQFKPVADLYGLTSPTGSETSFTFDAVEARDFIDGGWSCQEYVTLERYQEAITNHTEDKLAMVDHSGDSNNMVEPVTTAYKLRDAVETIRSSGIAIDADKIFAERDVLNSPVIPDGWVACSERMPEEGQEVIIMDAERGEVISGMIYQRGSFVDCFEEYFEVKNPPYWMPLPAAPQQEADNG